LQLYKVYRYFFKKINNRKFVENNEKDYIEKARNLYAIEFQISLLILKYLIYWKLVEL